MLLTKAVLYLRILWDSALATAAWILFLRPLIIYLPVIGVNSLGPVFLWNAMLRTSFDMG
jgi:hypothetical protein